MALQDPNAEPSMEEILASIRRIISEEEQPGGAPEPVLELSTPHVEPAPAPIQMMEEDDIVFDETPEPIVQHAPPPVAAPAPQPVRAAAPAPVQTYVDADASEIISSPTVSAAAGSLSRLAGSLRINENPNQTVEGVVRELLKPMLKAWLDQNLPAIVEARVEAELERIARLAR